MFRRLEGFLQFDELLRSPQRYTLQALAATLERSQRTVQYDIDFLRDCVEAPIEENRKQGWHESQSMTELANGWLRFEVDTCSLAEVKRWVLGFSAGRWRCLCLSVIAREPPELVEMVLSELESMSEQYKEIDNGCCH